MTDKTIQLEIPEGLLKIAEATRIDLREVMIEALERRVLEDSTANRTLDEQRDWTQEELAELLSPSEPKSGAEIAAMINAGGLDMSAWSQMINPHITDSVEWVKALRGDIARKRNLDWDHE
jgi:hypothetical protein